MAEKNKFKEALRLPTEDELEKQQELKSLVYELFEEYNEGETLFSQIENDLTTYKDFYIGDKNAQWDGQPEGELKLVSNIGASIIDLFTYILANSPPTIQFVPMGADPVSQTRANFGEEMANRLLENARFPIKLRDGVKNQFMMGYSLLYPFWNKRRKDGGENGTYDLTVLNPFTTRVVFDSDDYESIKSFITWNRVNVDTVKEKYDYEAVPDAAIKILPSNYEHTDDDKVTVFTRFTDKEFYMVANGDVIDGPFKHGLDKAPIYKIDNVKTPGDVFGRPEIERWIGICQEINALLTAASEIARDLGYPPLLEINNALGGKKPHKWRNQKIPVRKSDKSEALRYLVNPAQIAPLLEQARFLIDLLHFVSLMPKAASGIFSSNVTSGFQAKLAMQPATLTTDGRKVDWNYLIKDMVKDAFKLLKEHDPEALKINIEGEDGEQIEMENIADHEIEVHWGETLPIDISRQVQNLIMGMQNNLTSVTQAVDRYNALMEMGSPTDTFSYLRQEANDPEISPDRALKVAKVGEQISKLSQTLDSANSKLTDLRSAMNNGEGPLPENLREARENANPNNLVRGASSPMPEERRPSSPTARESVNPNSTGGMVIPPIPGVGTPQGE